MNLVWIEEPRGAAVGTGAPTMHQVGDAPGNAEEQGQRPFELLNRAELQGLGASAIFQHIKQYLDFPPAQYLSIKETAAMAVSPVQFGNDRHSRARRPMARRFRARRRDSQRQSLIRTTYSAVSSEASPYR